MTEASALSLARLQSKEEFLSNHAAGKHTFPVMASLKIIRRVTKNSSSASSNNDSSQLQRADDEQTYVNFTVVEAIDQPFDIAPTQTMLDLFPLMPRLAQDSACIIAAPLHLLRVSASYAFQVCLPKSLNSVVMPCQKVVTLIKATKASEPVPIGHGYKLVTTDVEDFLGSDIEQLAPANKQKFTISSTCTLKNMPAYRLDPVREKPQYAMVTVTGQADDVFVVEVVQLLSEEEARQAKQSLTTLVRFAVDLHSTTLKRSAPWTVDDSPVNAKKMQGIGTLRKWTTNGGHVLISLSSRMAITSCSGHASLST